MPFLTRQPIFTKVNSTIESSNSDEFLLKVPIYVEKKMKKVDAT